MAHGPRPSALTQLATYESVHLFLYIRSYTIYNVSHMFSIILSLVWGLFRVMCRVTTPFGVGSSGSNWPPNALGWWLNFNEQNKLGVS
jgi:hypothetical protein